MPVASASGQARNQASTQGTGQEILAGLRAEAWQRRTESAPALRNRLHLYQLSALPSPEPVPEGRERVVGEPDHERLVRWCRESCVDIGEHTGLDAIDTGASDTSCSPTGPSTTSLEPFAEHTPGRNEPPLSPTGRTRAGVLLLPGVLGYGTAGPNPEAGLSADSVRTPQGDDADGTTP